MRTDRNMVPKSPSRETMSTKGRDIMGTVRSRMAITEEASSTIREKVVSPEEKANRTNPRKRRSTSRGLRKTILKRTQRKPKTQMVPTTSTSTRVVLRVTNTGQILATKERKSRIRRGTRVTIGTKGATSSTRNAKSRPRTSRSKTRTSTHPSSSRTQKPQSRPESSPRPTP